MFKPVLKIYYTLFPRRHCGDVTFLAIDGAPTPTSIRDAILAGYAQGQADRARHEI